MGRHGAPSASLGSGSARAPPEAGQVRATRRSDAIPRPRAGCPATSAAGLIKTVKRDARGQHELRCPGLLPSRSLPARLQRLAPAARQKKKSGSTPWVVGACVTRGGHRMSAWSRCQRCHELVARTTVRAAVQALLRRSTQTPVHPAWALSSGAGPSAWTPTCEHDRRGH